MTTQYTSLLPSKYNVIKNYKDTEGQYSEFNSDAKIILLNYRAHRLDKRFLKKLLINWSKKINKYSVIFGVIHDMHKQECGGLNIYNINRNNLGSFSDEDIIVNIRATIKLKKRLTQSRLWFNIPLFRTRRHKDTKFKPGLIGFINSKSYCDDLGEYIYTINVYDLGKYIGKGTWFGKNIIHYDVLTQLLSN